ncbi:hypothetical protein Syun_031828 [Stephania yunnanensis]|uniref:Secreted protein n=1 Tax=Stephania yunnanensis TaxID=152371 RepID=A0AAP0DWL2_9MAGN
MKFIFVSAFVFSLHCISHHSWSCIHVILNDGLLVHGSRMKCRAMFPDQIDWKTEDPMHAIFSGSMH